MIKLQKIDSDLNLSDFDLNLSVDKISDERYYRFVNFQRKSGYEWKASTKNRSAVSGGGAKPYKQKGTGNARRGTSRSPLKVGGGVVFGPTYRKPIFKMNKREAFDSHLSLIFNSDKSIFSFDSNINIASTKDAINLLSKLNLQSDSKLLFLVDGSESYIKFFRNLPNVKFSLYHSVEESFVQNSTALIFSNNSLSFFEGN